MKKLSKTFDASILVVDDYELNLDLTKSFLELLGCSVTTASSGPLALEKLQEQTFDLIFLDIQMPEMDGMKVAEMVRQKHKIPIIAMTAHALTGDKEKFLASGMDGYVSKPISGEVLEETLSRYL